MAFYLKDMMGMRLGENTKYKWLFYIYIALSVKGYTCYAILILAIKNHFLLYVNMKRLLPTR